MNSYTSPFKFLDSYQRDDFEIFFGRQKETEALYNALSGVKHLLVYGPSGAGKTSLIECGLRNQFSDADWFALTIRRGADINAAVFARINEVLTKKIVDPDTGILLDPKMEFGDAIEQLFSERYQPVYLLFDQFEELLISGEEVEKSQFFLLLNKLIRNKVPCRVLLIMREEFIGHLSEFEALCPSIFHHRFRVEQMGRSNVEAVIYEILESPEYRSFFDVEQSRQLARGILSKLPDRKKEIELAHVQVFLTELWERARESKPDNRLPVLNATLVHIDDNLERILESFLKKQMADLELTYGERVPLELLAAMISEKFTKLQLSETAILKELEAKKVVSRLPIANLLADLVQRRIIRTIRSSDERQYEISHDVLALVVGQNLTEEMKMREKAEDTYRFYEDRQGLFSQDDIDYLRLFQQSLPYPPRLEARIELSITTIEEQRKNQIQEAEKVAALEREKERAEKEAVLRMNAEIAKRIAETATFKARRSSRVAIIVAAFAAGAAVLAGLAFTSARRSAHEALLSQKQASKALQVSVRQGVIIKAIELKSYGESFVDAGEFELAKQNFEVALDLMKDYPNDTLYSVLKQRLNNVAKKNLQQ